MSDNPFLKSFLPGKKRTIRQQSEVEIEPEVDTEEELEPEASSSKKKIVFLYPVMLLFCLLLFGRSFQLQVILGGFNQQRAEENRLRIRIKEAPRGIIFDRHLSPLTKNVPAFFLEIYPNELPARKADRLSLYRKIHEKLGLPLSQLEEVEKRILNQEPFVLKANMSQEEAILLESKITELPAIKISVKPQREYPSDSAFSHILGYVGDKKGQIGLEAYYDSYLRGEDGKEEIEVDALGRVKRILSSVDPQPGADLILSIDFGLQQQMTKSLASMLGKTKTKAGVAIALNPQNGEILGLVSLPAYDNNLFARGIQKEEYEHLVQDPTKPMFHRAIAGLYPPGSVIKPVIGAAALAEKLITPETFIYDPGTIVITNPYNPAITYRFKDWKPGGHGRVNLLVAIEQSCDVFFYALGGGWQNIQGLGEKKLRTWLSRFGLGAKTGIDLPGENEGFVPSARWKEEVKKEIWYQGDSYHLAIGQGDLLVTPLQVAQYTAYFANGGVAFQPHLVSEIHPPNKEVIKIKPKVAIQNLISPEDTRLIREGMRRVITQGTARSLNNLPFTLAGKTGTAQNPHGQPHAWFVAFAPYENPQIVTVVLVENGGEGSSTAVPVTREILEYWYTHLYHPNQ